MANRTTDRQTESICSLYCDPVYSQRNSIMTTFLIRSFLFFPLPSCRFLPALLPIWFFSFYNSVFPQQPTLPCQTRADPKKASHSLRKPSNPRRPLVTPVPDRIFDRRRSTLGWASVFIDIAVSLTSCKAGVRGLAVQGALVSKDRKRAAYCGYSRRWITPHAWYVCLHVCARAASVHSVQQRNANVWLRMRLR
jgi:hypothetical protein